MGALSDLLAASRTLADEDVVSRVRQGEVELFEILMRRHNQRLYRTARAVLGRDAEAEDAVQQAWVSAYAHLSQFAGDARFSTWLTRILLNETFRRRSRLGRRPEIGLEVLEEGGRDMRTPPADGPEERTLRRETAALVEAAIDELPESYRVVVVLRYVQELSVAEAAACLELSEETVKVRAHRARAMLRRALAARMEAQTSEAYPFLGARCDRMVGRVLAILEGNSPA